MSAESHPASTPNITTMHTQASARNRDRCPMGNSVAPPGRIVQVADRLAWTDVPCVRDRGKPCAASLLADLGVPDVAIAAWLGHTTVIVTGGYTHVFAERLAETSRALGDALSG